MPRPLHILPDGFHKIRHFGLYSSTAVRERLSAAAAALGQRRPAPQPDATTPAIEVEDVVRDLTGVDLTGADLRGAKLFVANLRDADLTGADLTGADLTSAMMGGAKLDQTKGNPRPELAALGDTLGVMRAELREASALAPHATEFQKAVELVGRALDEAQEAMRLGQHISLYVLQLQSATRLAYDYCMRDDVGPMVRELMARLANRLGSAVDAMEGAPVPRLGRHGG